MPEILGNWWYKQPLVVRSQVGIKQDFPEKGNPPASAHPTWLENRLPWDLGVDPLEIMSLSKGSILPDTSYSQWTVWCHTENGSIKATSTRWALSSTAHFPHWIPKLLRVGVNIFLSRKTEKCREKRNRYWYLHVPIENTWPQFKCKSHELAASLQSHAASSLF